MNSFELTKISGAVLLTALAAMVISTVGNGLVHPKQHTAAVAEGAGGAKPAGPAKKEEAPI
ncbi:MAG: cytochrome c family protein, partial [Rhodospirillaceae bacterium]